MVHCSLSKASQNVTIDTIRDWHVHENGWDDTGYHWVIERCGRIRAGRNAQLQGAHILGHNHDSIAICLVGGLSEDNQPENNFTANQFLMLEAQPIPQNIRLKSFRSTMQITKWYV